MANPLVVQGTLNRLRGSVVVTDAPELTVTAPYLGKEGISISLEGETTLYLPTMTGAVTSAEPYQMVTITMHLLKTQFVADQYKQRAETLSTIGNVTVRTDASTLGNYEFINCAIKNPSSLAFNGQSADYMVQIAGYYPLNSSLFDNA